MQKEEYRFTKEFVKEFGFGPGKLKELMESAGTVQDFLQYIGSNQYYSEAVNKRIVFLTLDVDECLLKLEKLNVASARYRDVLARRIMLKKKETIDKAKAKKFSEEVDKVEEELLAAQEKAITLTSDIKNEYKSKQGV